MLRTLLPRCTQTTCAVQCGQGSSSSLRSSLPSQIAVRRRWICSTAMAYRTAPAHRERFFDGQNLSNSYNARSGKQHGSSWNDFDGAMSPQRRPRADQHQAFRQRSQGSARVGRFGGKAKAAADADPRSYAVFDAEKELPAAVSRAGKKYISGSSTAARIVRWGITGKAVQDFAKKIALSEAKDEDTLNDVAHVEDLLDAWWSEARHAIKDAVDDQGQGKMNDFWDGFALRNITRDNAEEELPRQCAASFLSWLDRSLSSTATGRAEEFILLQIHIRMLLKVVDLRYPSLVATGARSIVRDIHLHVGPTNSGKTHGALLALCKARSGIYAGPLRLLAHEVWHRINSGTVSPGVPARACNLLTGEEKRVVDPNAFLQSCTVEMVPITQQTDVVVLDEIQMLGDPLRGEAWTTVLVQMPGREMHLCGENSVVPLVKRIAEACGDRVHVHTYERLTPLSVGPSPESLSNIRKGDCVVAFSRASIFRLKNEIEQTTGMKCAVVYGALPPETKAEQAKLFNDPTSGVDVIVASDAIGMGLNLMIKRVILWEVTKWDGSALVELPFSQIKQIAGRAGRYGTIDEEGEVPGGIVTTFKGNDLPILEKALSAPLKQISRAAIRGGTEHLNKLYNTLLPYSSQFAASAEEKGKKAASKRGGMSLQDLYSDMSLLTRIDTSTYFTGSLRQQTQLAPLIEDSLPPQTSLTLEERETFVASPTNSRNEFLLALLGNMVHRYASGWLVDFHSVEKGLNLLATLYDVEAVARRLNKSESSDGKASATVIAAEAITMLDSMASHMTPGAKVSQDEHGNAFASLDVTTLMMLETLHRGLTVYSWLSFRLPTAFCHNDVVVGLKVRTESAISYCLAVLRRERQRRLAHRGAVLTSEDTFVPKHSGEGEDAPHARM